MESIYNFLCMASIADAIAPSTVRCPAIDESPLLPISFSEKFD